VASDASRVGLGLLVVVLLGLVLARVIRSVRKGAEPLADRLARRPSVSWVRRRFPGMSARAARRVDTSSANGFILTFVVLAGAICAWVFIGITQDVVANEESALTDPRVMDFVVAHRIGWVTAAMKIVTWLGSNAVLIPLVVAVGGYFWFKDRTFSPAVFMVAALAGANLWYGITKSLVGRPRPSASIHLINVSGFAFPSGHATAVIATWGLAAVLLGAERSTRIKLALWGGAMGISLLVGASRIYLGVHWWTDVVAGFALGGLWLCILGVVFLTGRFVLGRATSVEPVDRSSPQSRRAA
jgi:membrane-associated phospholipid phosphatase